MPHISFAEAVKIMLVVFALGGTLRVVALSHPNSAIAQAFLLIY
jgi:hypothetical protein